MKFSFEIKIGQTKFIIEETAETAKEFFEKSAFFTGLPTTGPDGEDDLQLVHREVKGFEYYSIVSQKAKKEFKFGQHKDMKGLFPKGWEELYVHPTAQNNNSLEQGYEEGEEVQQPLKAAPPRKGLGSTGLGRQVSAPQPSHSAPVPSSNQPPRNSGANSQVTNDVLAKYGIRNNQG